MNTPSPIDEIIAQCLLIRDQNPEFDVEKEFDGYPQWREELATRWALIKSFSLVEGDSIAGTIVQGVGGRLANPSSKVIGHPGLELDARYRLDTQIGKGGMGEVWSAQDLELRRDVAVKLIGLPGLSKANRANFLREARIGARLEHPGVVPTHDIGLSGESTAYLVMKRVEGLSLEQRIKNLRATSASDRKEAQELLEPRAVAQCIAKLCDALAFAHSVGIYHCDLKPANVMVGRFGEIQLMDWGIACILEEVSTPQGSEAKGYALVRGTPAYMSPEQARGAVSELKASTDVFGVGAILHAMLTGKPPYIGQREEETCKMAKHGRRSDPELRDAWQQVPRELVGVCNKAMHVEPGKRYASVRALQQDLQAFLILESGEAWKDGPVKRFTKWVARNPGVASAGVALVVAVSAISLAWTRGNTIRSQRLANQILQIQSEGPEAVQLAYEQHVESFEHSYDQAALAIKDWIGSHGVDLSDPKLAEIQMLQLCDSTLPGASQAFDSLQFAFRKWARYVQLAGGQFGANPDSVLAPDDPKRGLAPGNAALAKEVMEKNLSRSPELRQDWVVVEALGSALHQDGWAKETWDHFLLRGKGASPNEVTDNYAPLMQREAPWTIHDVNWLATLAGRSSTKPLGGLQKLVQEYPSAHVLLGNVASMQKSHAGALRGNPGSSVGAGFKFEERAVQNSKVVLALQSRSVDAHVDYAMGLAAMADNYYELAVSIHNINVDTQGAEGRLEGLRNLFLELGMDHRHLQIQTLRKAHKMRPDGQPAILLSQALAAFTREYEQTFNQTTRDLAQRRGYLVEKFKREALQLMEQIGVKMKHSLEWRHTYAFVLFKMGDNRAVEELEAVLLQDPKNFGVKSTLARCLIIRYQRTEKDQDRKRALELLLELIEQHPGDGRYAREVQVLENANPK